MLREPRGVFVCVAPSEGVHKMATASPSSTTTVATLPSLLTTGEVQAALRCSRQTVYNLRNRGQLRAIKIGNATRFRLDQVLAFINGGAA
jgi:excisionase family DNA binding protein